MALNKEDIKKIYGKRAKRYDISANLYYLLGVREFAYRKRAVDALKLSKGDTVVEIGCGTGLNFKFLRESVGQKGKIIGVDLTSEMLSMARERIERNKWLNVELVQSDAATYEFPEKVDGIISTFAITLIPEYDAVIKRGANALSTGKRFVISDFKRPDNWPDWLVKFFVLIMRPFGVSLDMVERHPWESINRYLKPVQFEELYFGGIYISTGKT
jgi:demethylmenaquinone methyltransferase/2-methoxy-6-polyprenyl-1,4-benzoquinol methylase